MQDTFSCVYGTPGTEYCDESAYIDILASNLGVRSNRIEPQAADIPERHRQMIYYLDNPPESTLMSSWHTFLRVSQTDTVVTLDGQGADEQLAGYPRYVVPYLAHSNQVLREGRALAKQPGLARFVQVGLASHLTRAIGLGGLVPWALRRAQKQIYAGESLNEALVQDSFGGLQNFIHYADRTSMAFSIESRMPFLDYRIAEFLARVPACYKIHGGWTKYLARLAFDKRLPDEIVWRRDKMGWPIPEDHWFRTSLRSWYCEQIETSPFLKSLGKVVNVNQALDRGVPINLLTRLLNLATWHRVHVEQQWRPVNSPGNRVIA
jgi:asparagine synthase (glutamine-hydrolysing)